MRLVRYESRFLEPILALHRSAKMELEKLGVGIGISNNDEEGDLRDIESVYLKSGGEFLVGTLNREVMAMGGFQRLSIDSAELRRMRIRTDLQGKGYGSQLLQELEHIAFKSGIRTLSFQTARARKLTLEFYLKYGYKLTGEGFYGNIETAHFSKTMGSVI